MALAFVEEKHVQEAGGSSTLSVTLGAGPSSGDIALVLIRTASETVSTWPKSATAIFTSLSYGFGGRKGHGALKVCDGTEGTSWSATLSGGTFNGSMIVAILSGGNATNPEVHSEGTSAFTNTPSIPNITTLSDNAWHIAICFQSGESTWGTPPSGYTERALVRDIAFANKLIATAGATGTVNYQSGGTTDSGVGVSLSIAVAGGGATGQPTTKRMGGVPFMGQHGAGFPSAMQRW